VLIDTATQRRTDWLPADDTHQASAPRFSRDGARIALMRSTLSSPTDTTYSRLEIHPLAGGDPAVVGPGDPTVSHYESATDGRPPPVRPGRGTARPSALAPAPLDGPPLLPAPAPPARRRRPGRGRPRGPDRLAVRVGHGWHPPGHRRPALLRGRAGRGRCERCR